MSQRIESHIAANNDQLQINEAVVDTHACDRLHLPEFKACRRMLKNWKPYMCMFL